jgi:hypothetical protein
VNQLVGDSAFWNGLRLYTSDQWGRAAASEDLQKAFDAVNTGNGSTGKEGGASKRKKNSKNTPKPLDNLFDLWVYGVPNTAKEVQVGGIGAGWRGTTAERGPTKLHGINSLCHATGLLCDNLVALRGKRAHYVIHWWVPNSGKVAPSRWQGTPPWPWQPLRFRF